MLLSVRTTALLTWGAKKKLARNKFCVQGKDTHDGGTTTQQTRTMQQPTPPPPQPRSRQRPRLLPRQSIANNLSDIEYPHHAEIDVERYRYTLIEMLQMTQVPMLKVLVIILAFTSATILSNMFRLALETVFVSKLYVCAMKVLIAMVLAVFIALVLAYIEAHDRTQQLRNARKGFDPSDVVGIHG
jgi:hypothetical protein